MRDSKYRKVKSSKIRNSVGGAMENLIKKELDVLKQEGMVYTYVKDENLDKSGIDFFIVLTCGHCVPLQVKSSIKYQRRHRRKYPEIPSIAGIDRIVKRKKIIVRILKCHKREIVLHLNYFSKLKKPRGKTAG